MQPAPGTEVATASEMIEALGGPVQVAALFELESYRVPSMWRHRDRIPPIYRPKMADLLKERGYRYPESFLLPPTKASQ